MSVFQDFREQYPQYHEVDDDTLAQALHQKYYSDMDYGQFRQRVGLAVAEPATLSDRIDQKIQEPKRQLSSMQDDGTSRLDNFLADDESERGFFDTAIRRVGERATELAGQFVSGVDTVAQAAEEALPMGGFVFEEDSLLPRYAPPDEFKALSEKGMDNIVAGAGADLKGMDFDAVPKHTWDEVKRHFSEEGVASGMGEVLLYAGETGIASIPDMAAVIVNLPGYVFARSAEIGETRAQNKGKEQTDLVDMMEAAPFALGSALLERIGAKGILSSGTEAVEQVGKEALKTIAKRAGGAAGKEAGTEFIQEGIIEYLGERFGTGAQMDFMEAAERGLAGAVAGGVYGGGTTAVMQAPKVFDTKEKQLARAMDAEIEGGEFTMAAGDVAAQALDPTNSQVSVSGDTIFDMADSEKGDSSSRMPQPQELSDAEYDYDFLLTHESSSSDFDGAITSRMDQSGVGVFDGIFALEGEKGAAIGPGGYHHTYAPRKGRVAGQGDVDLDYDQSIAFLKKEFPEASGDQLSALYELTAEDRNFYEYIDYEVAGDPTHSLIDFLPADVGEASWELQNIRGRMAVDQNFDAIAMSDENGVSFFIPHGSKAKYISPEQSSRSQGASEQRPTITLSQRSTTQAADTLDMQPGTNYAPLISKYGDLPITPNREYQLGSGRTVRIPKQPVNRRHIIKTMQKRLGNRIYEGKIKGKTRLGFYRNRIGEIRIKHKNDLEVTAHEVAHWLDDRYAWVKPLYKQFDKEIRSVSYDKNLDYEGWAEFMRLWFTQEHEARQRAPGFYDAFSEALSNPERADLADTLYDVQEQMHAWFMQGVRARMASKVGDHDLPISERLTMLGEQAADKVLQKTLDRLHAFKVAEVEVRGEVADATLSPYKSFRLAAGYAGVAKAVLNHGTVGWTKDGNIEFTGDSLKAIFARVEDVMEDAQLYFVARRAQELSEQGRENLFRPDEIQYGLSLGEKNPAIKTAFEEWLKFNDRMLDFYQDSGIIGAGQRAAIQTINKNYVPFNRVIETAADIAGGRKNKVARAASPLVRLKGGTGNINDVFDNIVNNTTTMLQMALNNHSKRMFYNMLDNADGQTAAMYAVKIPPAEAPVNIDSEQVKKAMVQGLGLTMREYRMAREMPSSPEEIAVIGTIDMMMADMGDYVTFFQHGLQPTGNVDFYFNDGKKVYYEVGDPLLYDAITHLGPQAHGLAVNILGGFANVLRYSVTATPVFQVKNFIRDTMNAFTLSKGKIVPAYGAMKALFQRVYNEPQYWEYMANGGDFASVAEADGISADRIVHIESAAQKYTDIISAFETANRLAEFKALKKKGVSAREATFAGREISTDFAMRGTSQALRVFTISIPFLNARLQSHYRQAREIGARRPGGKWRIDPHTTFNYALRSMIAITLPSLALYMLIRDDERYLEQPDWVKDLSWFVPTGTGEDDYILIPKPFETGIYFGSIPERMLAKLREEEHGEELTNAILWMAMESFGLDLIPQAFKPLDDLRRNKSFTGAPIVPEYMKNVEPSEQYRAYTSDAMIALGRAMNISPIKAEYLVRGYLGTLGTWALGGADYIVGDLSEGGEATARGWQDNILISPFVNDGPLRRTKSETLVYDMLKETRRAVSTVNLMERRSPERIEQYLSEAEKKALYGANRALERQAKTLRELRTQQDMISASPDLSGEEKREAIQEVQRAINKVTREARKAIDLDDIQAVIEQAELANAQQAAP